MTNLYSSAIFIGWGAVIVSLILERIFRDGIGAACAGAIGFVTLIIAHHLAGSGDTLEMLQAVLDTNIWLATHVVAITTGYSAMFLAGMLAIIYIVRGVFTRSLNKQTADSLARMTYGWFASPRCSVLSELCSVESGPINRGAVSGAGTRRKMAPC